MITLPSVIRQFAPVGIMGLLPAGLIAAFVSTCASTVTFTPAYLVDDREFRLWSVRGGVTS